MAGFLAHLATRLGGSGELLRPRLPSLFEPAPTVALDPTSARGLPADQHPLARGFEHLDETDLQVFADTLPAAVRARPSRDQHGSDAIVTSGSADRRDELRSQAAHDDPMASVDPHRAAARLHTRSFSDLTVSPTEGAPASSEASAAIRPASIFSRGPMAPKGQRHPVDAAEQPDALPTRVPTTGASVAIDRESGPETIRGSAPEATGILQAPVVARIVAEPRFSAPRAPESEPTIHVTIGRVEVRAVASSAADNRRGERMPSPVISLDEYLRTRAR